MGGLGLGLPCSRGNRGRGKGKQSGGLRNSRRVPFPSGHGHSLSTWSRIACGERRSLQVNAVFSEENDTVRSSSSPGDAGTDPQVGGNAQRGPTRSIPLELLETRPKSGPRNKLQTASNSSLSDPVYGNTGARAEVKRPPQEESVPLG